MTTRILDPCDPAMEDSLSLGSCRSFYRDLPPQYGFLSEDPLQLPGRDSTSLGSSSGSDDNCFFSTDDEMDNDNDDDDDDSASSERMKLPFPTMMLKTNNNKVLGRGCLGAVTASPTATLPTDTEPSFSEDETSAATSHESNNNNVMILRRLQRRALLTEFAQDGESDYDATQEVDDTTDDDEDEDAQSSFQNANLDRIQVAIRLKPVTKTDSGRMSRRCSRMGLSKRSLQLDKTGHNAVWKVDANHGTIALNSTSRKHSQVFQYDAVFDEDTTTAQVYKSLFQPTVRAVLTGRHATVFAYGQTGSGKTYTMQGDESAGVQGLIQLAALDLFEQIKQDTTREYTLRVKYFEIYNEQIRDLLTVDSFAEDGDEQRQARRRSVQERRLQVREDKHGNPTVDAFEEEVFSVDDVLRLLNAGNINRAKESTLLNDSSSRSHAIFRISLESRKLGDETKRVAVLNLVDLAGSENSTNSGSTGMRLREGSKINQSLLSLSRVIHSLSLPPNKRPKHIGYRDSNLTRILQPHLSGNACMAVMCCVSTSPSHIEETRSTLKFALRAKEVEMAPLVNEVVDHSAQVFLLQKELSETKKALMELEKCFLHQLTKSRGSPSKWLRMAMSSSAPTADSDSESYFSGSSYDTSDASSEAVAGEGMDELNESMLRSRVIPYNNDAAQSLRAGPIFPVHEVVVLSESSSPLKAVSDARAALIDAERRALFLEEKLEITDDLVESLFLELEQLRRFNKELKSRNEQLASAHMRRDEEESDIILLIKYTFYLGFAFYLAGQNELFMATMMFLWLSLEVAA